MKSSDNENMRTEFEKVYGDNADALFRFCLVRVSQREQALDLVQDAFTRLWQSMLRGQEIKNPRAFLYTVAHRLVIDWYRKKKSLSLDSLTDEETGEPYEPVGETASADLEAGAEGRFLIGTIEKLEPSYRRAVYLRFVEGLSPPEIGEILGISGNAASVRVNRGLQALRELTGYNGDLKTELEPT